MSQSTMIPIERLTSGVAIFRKGGDFGPFGGAAEVVSVEFDPDGFYVVDALFIESDGSVEWTGDEAVRFFVDPGEKVEFAGRGLPPFMRLKDDVTAEEWQAKGDALSAETDRAIGQINQVSGYRCRAIDERPLVEAVAAALEVEVA